ncbi:MAG: MaoC/PaaZ C-terminal domain-containing protein [Halobacteriota archaeon]
MTANYFEDFAIGDSFTTTARTITEADQSNFAGLSGNFDPIHLDEERMRESSFGGRLVYGLLVLSIVAGQKIQRGIWGDSVIALYGIDSLRFTAPVFIGDTIHTELTVLDLEDRDDESGVVLLEERAVNQDGEDVVVAETRTLIEKRSASSGSEE